MSQLHPDLLKQLKEYYKPGTKVMLVRSFFHLTPILLFYRIVRNFTHFRSASMY